MTDFYSINDEATVKKRTNNVTRVLEGKAIILLKENQRPLRLNETGTKIWEWMDKPRRKKELTEMMCAAYQTEKSQAAADLDSFLAELHARNLIETDE